MFTSAALVSLLVLLSTGWLTTQAAEPNCASVADFDNCPGITHDFCPEGVACGCKDQIPFCKCPSYRSGWKDHWYMGPKCEQLWSTLDLILIVVLPAITLSLAVAITMQWVSYCKDKRENGVKQSSTHAKQTRAQAPHNDVPNLADKLRYASHPQGKENPGASQKVKFPKYPLRGQPHEQIQSPQIGGFSYIPHQPLRRANPNQDDVFAGQSSQVGQLAYWETEIPDMDYEEANPFSAMPMQPFPKPGASMFSQPGYQRSTPQPINYLNGQRAGRPSGIGH
ncbi:uncharacterized protein LOC133371493 [Rhineura floridana]|uniref:uncharacterized protein LOC133371493 n=1 Tax=Rhineura floridana TaxID=261503 RepID=UPI002AC869E8|nr:uncharacterized protein LOC133371493 [Rhineura floridana]